MIVLESNQNHAIAEETEVSPTLPASMGMGGGYIPMIVVDDEKSNRGRPIQPTDHGDRVNVNDCKSK